MILNAFSKVDSVTAHRGRKIQGEQARRGGRSDTGGNMNTDARSLSEIIQALAPRVTAMPPSALSPQDTALIFNACARAGYAGGEARPLLLHLSASARASPAAAFTGQSIGVTMSALAQVSGCFMCSKQSAFHAPIPPPPPHHACR